MFPSCPGTGPGTHDFPDRREIQPDIVQNGHAIECRIYAEDPENNFAPSPGDITLLSFPEGQNIRIDTAIDKATTIQSFFDPMISKLIVWGPNRQAAINDSISALKNFIIHGIKTNITRRFYTSV